MSNMLANIFSSQKDTDSRCLILFRSLKVAAYFFLPEISSHLRLNYLWYHQIERYRRGVKFSNIYLMKSGAVSFAVTFRILLYTDQLPLFPARLTLRNIFFSRTSRGYQKKKKRLHRNKTM